MSVTTQEALADLKKLRAAALKEAAAEIDEATRRVNAEQAKTIPVRTGKLLKSRFVERAKVRGSKVEGSVGAGKDGDPFYALLVHESPGRKGWKFLENPATREVEPLRRRLDKAADRAAKKALRE